MRLLPNCETNKEIGFEWRVTHAALLLRRGSGWVDDIGFNRYKS
jgi:hypothetical protein